jgi:hypothetical protein
MIDLDEITCAGRASRMGRSLVPRRDEDGRGRSVLTEAVMKAGRSLVELATELERQVTSRKDYLAPTTALSVVPHEQRGLSMLGLNGDEFPIKPYAHRQIATELEIPQRYYDRMQAASPELLATNVNHWLRAEPRKRMVRTLDREVRAFLSDRYRPLDNVDLAEVAFPILNTRGATIRSCELTETRLYIKATLATLSAEVRGSRQRGDVVEAGVVISNSEIGAGSVRVEPMVFRLMCLNGAIAGTTMRKYHIGRGEGDDQVREVLTSEARRADDKAFWLKARDVIASAFDRDIFNALVAKMEDATQHAIVSNKLETVVEVTTKTLGIVERQGSVLRHLIDGGDLSKWGLMNAITAAAQDEDLDYDAATEMERAGAKVLELSQPDWKKIAEAA